MNTRVLVLALVVVISAALLGRPVVTVGQDEPPAKKADGDKPKMDPKKVDQIMQDQMKQAAPGEAHKLLAKMAGKWDVESKMWMNPNGPPMKTTGKSTSRVIYGGRFVMQNGEMQVMG